MSNCSEFHQLIIRSREVQKTTIMDTQFVTNNKGEKIAVILPIDRYQKLLEELEDIRAYDEVKSRNEERVSLDEILKIRT